MTSSTPMWRRARGWSAPQVLRHLGMGQPPVDPYTIAKHFGIEVREVPDPGWLGAAQSDSERAIVWLDSQPHPRHRRYTLAHELGHVMLHPTGEHRCLTFRGPVEAQASMFGRRLLMSPPWLEMFWANSGYDPVRMSEIFMVPRKSMHVWLAYLGMASWEGVEP